MRKNRIAFVLAGVMAVTALNSISVVAENESITISVFDSEAYALDRYDEMAKNFEAAHPGVTVEAQHVTGEANAILMSRFSADDIPDVIALTAGVTAKNYYEYAYDWSEDTEVLEKFGKTALNTGLDDEGRVMSLPRSYENMGLLYNKDCFEKAGITELPGTLDELEEACKKLKEAGITPIAIAAKEAWVLQQLSTHFMMDKALDARGVVDGLNSGELTFADLKNFNNLFRFLDLAVEYGPEKPLEVDWETSENMLANGKAAIIHMGDWCQAMLDEFNPDAQIAFLPCPVSDNPEDATILSSVAWTYVAYKDSENLELAKEYIEYILSSEDGQDWLCKSIGTVPGAKTEKEISGALANDAGKYIAEGKVNGWIHTEMPSGYQQEVGAALQSYMLGEMPAEDVVEWLQEAWLS